MIHCLQNSFQRGLKTSLRLLLFILLSLFLTSCSDRTLISNSTEKAKNFAILGPISNGDVTLSYADSNKIIYTTKTKAYTDRISKLKWNSYEVGSFDIDLNDTIDTQRLFLIKISNGEDIDSNDDGIITNASVQLQGVMKAYCFHDDLKNGGVIVNIFTTIAADLYNDGYEKNTTDIKSYMDSFAKTVFRKSVDSDLLIDYRDLFHYIPNETDESFLVTPDLYKNLISYGVMDAVLNDANITSLLTQDADGDKLDLWHEIVHGTSPNNSDTDSDGIDDYTEVMQGLDPTLKDSDYDGIDDLEEETIYFTDPLNPDSDNDYLPDYEEIRNHTDPLNPDENNNSVADGLDGDPFFKYQWYIKSNGDIVCNTNGVATVAGVDLDILDVYHETLGDLDGNKSIVQVVDTGVEVSHEDLEVDLNNSLNAVNGSNNPTPTYTVLKSDPASPLDVGHGNAVAGILAAKTNNGLGVRGIVARAKIAGSNWLEDQTLAEAEKVWYSKINDDRIAVSNNSWGAYFFQDEGYERVLALATQELRQKKGRIFTFASGNFRETYGNANLSYLSNNPYAITVASLNHENKYASYSNPGSNVLVSAYGGEHYYTAPTIMTTLLMGESYFESELAGRKGVITVDEDINKNYTYAMNGTSAATPMVSGEIVLTIDACPSLTYRDVKWLIAHTATKIDPTNQSWVLNGAGLWHSVDYGYGKINALKMIQTCRSKYFTHLSTLQTESVEVTNINMAIPDTNQTVYKDIVFDKQMKIEWVGLTIDSDHPFSGDLDISLVSPVGTRTSIITPNETHYGAYDGGFRFGSVAFVDEESLGTWRVEITDRLKEDYGNLRRVKLEIYGH